MENKSITINDIANELGVSTSTVSRAISGKGRIGSETRDRILAYIKEKDFHLNTVAHNLAGSKTGNIAIVLPDINNLEEMPYYQMCMYGAMEVASANGFDLMIVTSDGKDTRYLDRLIRNRKIDGMIVTRTYTDGRLTNYLKLNGVPFVAVGKVDDEDVMQLEHDHVGAAKELTTLLLMKGLHKIAYLGDDREQWLNRNRYEGYERAHRDANAPFDNSLVYRRLNSVSAIEAALEEAIKAGADCILCQDDLICKFAYKKLISLGLDIPSDIKMASCYEGSVSFDSITNITAARFDILELGRSACKMLIDSLKGKNEVKSKILEYQIVLKESTK